MNKRVIAVDFGLKRVGLATGNTLLKVPTALDAVFNKSDKFLAESLFAVVSEWGADLIVFGNPLNMNKEHEKNLVKTKLDAFVEYFREFMVKKASKNIDISFQDERLSTFEAKSLLMSMGLNYKEMSSKKDSASAMLILKRWFDNIL